MENKDKTFTLRIRGQEVVVSEEVYRAYIRPVRAEKRRKQRACRCKIKGKRLNLVRCKKDCHECPYVLSGHNALGNNLSLDRMKDDGIEIEDRSLDVEQNYIDEEEKRELYAAIAQLTPRQREMISLFYFDGLPQDKVAQKLGVSQAAVSVTLERAIANLKKIMKN